METMSLGIVCDGGTGGPSVSDLRLKVVESVSVVGTHDQETHTDEYDTCKRDLSRP